MYMGALEPEEFFELAGLQAWQRPKRRARSAGALRTASAIAELFDEAMRPEVDGVLFQTALAGAECQEFYRPDSLPAVLKTAKFSHSTQDQGDVEARLWAARKQRLQKLQALVRCLPKDRVLDGLLTACGCGDVALYRALRERLPGGSSCVEHSTRKTLLHLAAQHGHLEICKDLVESQADVTASDICGRTPMHLACTYAKAPVVHFLLQSRAHPEQEDREQRSAFHMSCLSSDPKIPWMLLQVQPRLARLIDGSGRSALHYALLNTHRQQWGGSARRRMLKLLLESEAEVNAVDCYSRSPLWYASRNGMAHSVALLLNHGADPELRDCDGRVPLDVVRGVASEQLLGYDTRDSAEDMESIRAGFRELELMDYMGELDQMHVAIAKREAFIEELEAELQDSGHEKQQLACALPADVSGTWLLIDDGYSTINFKQDPHTGDISGEIATPGKRALALHGKMKSNQLIYELGTPGRQTTFVLHLKQNGEVLSGSWTDYRGTSGSQELVRDRVMSESS